MKTAFRQTALSALTALLLVACGGEDAATLLGSAKGYLAKNDSKAAIIQIKNALQKDPNLAEGRFLLGKALLESGNPAAAEVELRKARDLKYDANALAPLLVKALLGQGQAKKALDEFGKFEPSTPEAKAEFLTLISGAQFTLGEHDTARATLASALAVKPDHVPAQLTQARLKFMERDMDGAMAIADAVLARSPNEAEALKLKGDLLRAGNKPDEAVAAYDKAIAAQADHLPSHTAVVGILLAQGKVDEAEKRLAAMKKLAPMNPQTLFLTAQLAYFKKNYAAARETLQSFHKVSAPNPLSQQLSGAVEYQLGAYGIAEDMLAKALQAEPNLPLARRLLIATYLRLGQTAKAMETLTPVIDKIDDSPAMLALAGEVFIQAGDFKKAEELYSKASRLDPKDAVKRTRLAMTHLAEGKAEGVEELAAISSDDKGSSADLALIAAHLRQNEVDKALAAVDTLEKKQPQDPKVFNIRGQILLAKKDPAGARKSFEKALSLQPGFFPAAASLASLDLAEKKPEDARRRFETLLAADPRNVPAQLALAEMAMRSGAKGDEVAALVNKAVTANPTDVTARLALIETYLRAKEAKKAIVAAQDAIAAIPNRAELLDASGRAHLAAGDTHQAMIAFGKFSSMQPKSPVPYLRMAEVNLASQNKEEAIKTLQKGLAIAPDYLEGQRALIMLYVDASKFKEANAVARDIQARLPKQPVGYSFEGDIAVAQKAWPDAIKAYRLGLERAPATELALKLSTVLNAAGQKAEADKLAAAWLKDHPKDPAFRNFLAESAISRQDWPTAVQHYRALLELQPDSPTVLNNLAWAASKIRDPKALSYAEKANQIAPDQPVFMDTLAMLLSESGDTARSKTLFSKALELQPDLAVVRMNFARMLIKAGDKASAKAQLDILAKLGDKFPEQAEVTKLLKEL